MTPDKPGTAGDQHLILSHHITHTCSRQSGRTRYFSLASREFKGSSEKLLFLQAYRFQPAFFSMLRDQRTSLAWILSSTWIGHAGGKKPASQ